MIDSILNWFYTQLQTILDWLYGVFSSVLGSLASWLTDFPREMFDYLIITPLEYFDLNPTQYLEDSIFTQIYELIAFLIPLNGMLTIISANLTIVLSVRTIRWGLALVPTVGG